MMNLDEMKAIREQFAKDGASARQTRSSDNNSYGAFILKDGSYHKIGKWVCHGWLSAWNVEECHANRQKYKEAGISYVLSHVMKPHVSDALLRRFIDWLVNRSPWQHIFVTKDVDDILEYGYVVDANYPTAFITSAFIASRFISESYTAKGEIEKRCAVYEEMLNMGVSENEAFFFAHMYTGTSKKGVYPVSYSRWQSGHSTFYGSMYQEDYVRNFLRGHVACMPTPMLSEAKGYENNTINRLWSKYTSKDSFSDVVISLRPISKSEKVDHHIFRKAPAVGYEYKDREDFMSVIEQLRGIINA